MDALSLRSDVISSMTIISLSTPHTMHPQHRKYRGTSLIRNNAPSEPNSRAMPRASWSSQGGGRFLMSEVPLYPAEKNTPHHLEKFVGCP